MRSLPPFATGGRVRRAALVVLCGVAQAGALAVAAFATRDAFATLHAGAPLPVATAMALLAAGAVAALCLLVSRRQAEALGQAYAMALRRVLYAQIARLPKARHEERRLGALALRFVGDLSAARLWFGRGLPDVLTALAVLPGAVAILCALDTSLALAGLLPLASALALMAAVAWHLDRRHRSLRRGRSGIAIAMIERIAIAPDLDLMGRTGRELRKLDEQGAQLMRHAAARRGRSAGLQAILQAGVATSGVVMLWMASRSGTAPATVAASLSVLALVAMPMQDLAAAWDRYCAWKVAREKAERLLAEPAIRRKTKGAGQPVAVTVADRIGQKTVRVSAAPAALTTITSPDAARLARLIAGLDLDETVEVLFDGAPERPRIGFVGDQHVGLQGSLRRAATLGARKRPQDARIVAVLHAFGLSDLLTGPQALDRRIPEAGRGLSAAQTLRLDLARVVLSDPAIVVISSLRYAADPQQHGLMQILRRQSKATVVLALPSGHSSSNRTSKAL